MSAAIASVIISGTSSLLSFSQANAQRKAQQQAENDADAAMAAAKGKLTVNFAEQQAIKKEAYDSVRLFLSRAHRLSMQALKVSEVQLLLRVGFMQDNRRRKPLSVVPRQMR